MRRATSLEIELPDGTILEAPDDADPSAVARAYMAKQRASSRTAGRNSFLRNAYGALPETLLSAGSSAIAAPVAGLAGIGARGLEAAGMLPQNAGADTIERVLGALTYRPRTDYARTIIEGAGVPLEKFAAFADRAGDIANQPAGRYLSGQAANAGLDPMREDQVTSPLTATLINTGIQSVPALLMRGRSGGVASDVNPRPGTAGARVASRERPPSAASVPERPARLADVSAQAPTKEQLKAASDAAYKRAEESGVVVTPESFGDLRAKISGAMKRDGIDPTLHPDSTAALKRIKESDGALTLQQLETLRRIANDAEGSIKPADRRLAGKMVDEIDEYIDGLTERDVVAGDAVKAKALKEARNLYSRRKKAEELDQLVARAELSAPNFSGSGMENALRTEFRNLAKNERRMRRFTREEQEAIKRVAKGGSLENALRMLGKLAPTGVVSGALSSGAGFVTGGPIGALALPAAGALARYGATRLTTRNVQLANALMRRGPLPATTLPQPVAPRGLMAEP
jgi:hypothetical protein